MSSERDQDVVVYPAYQETSSISVCGLSLSSNLLSCRACSLPFLSKKKFMTMQQKGNNLGLQLKLELQSMLLQKELYDFLIKERLSFFPRLLALVRFQTFLPEGENPFLSREGLTFFLQLDIPPN